MVTLKEAFRLCGIKDHEIVWFSDKKEGAYLWAYPMTGKEVRQKYDMRRTVVTLIQPHFNFNEWVGFLFIIKKEVS